MGTPWFSVVAGAADDVKDGLDPNAAASTLGEIARRTGAGGFHNQSLVKVVVG